MYDKLVQVYGEDIRNFLQTAVDIQEYYRSKADHARCMWQRSFVLLVLGLEHSMPDVQCLFHDELQENGGATRVGAMLDKKSVLLALKTTLPPFLQGVCQERDEFVRNTINIACMWYSELLYQDDM
jgi:hypothetical protein